jgi:hypothetical protein
MTEKCPYFWGQDSYKGQKVKKYLHQGSTRKSKRSTSNHIKKHFFKQLKLCEKIKI